MFRAALLSRDEIDTSKWDEFINMNGDDVIYFYAWYLDAVCPLWSAIIVEQNGCWHAVMPLQIKSKHAIQYSLQPMFCKYLGIIMSENNEQNVDKIECINMLLELVPTSLKYVNWNFDGTPVSLNILANKNYSIEQRHTYTLDLSDNDLQFSTSITNHIKKANRNYLSVVESIDPAPFIELCVRRRVMNGRSAITFTALWNRLQKRKNGRYYSVNDGQGNLLCGAILMRENNRVFMLLSVVDPTHKHLGANSLLLSEIIKIYRTEYAKYFCFGGSMYKNVAKYLMGFHPTEHHYYSITKSKLPFLKKVMTIKERWCEIKRT
jgi:hypothetical protein